MQKVSFSSLSRLKIINDNKDPKKMPPSEKNNQQKGNNLKSTKKPKSKLWKTLWISLGVLVSILILTLIFAPRANDLTVKQIIALANAPKDALKGVNIDVYFYTDNLAQFVVQIPKAIKIGDVTFQKGTYITALNSLWLGFPSFLKELSTIGGANVRLIIPQTPFLLSLILALLPWVIFGLISWFIIKLVMDKQTGQLGFGKSQSKPQTSSVRFNDIAGYEEIKLEMKELVDFLKEPEKFKNRGIRTPKGVLLSGPPGTGKTLFAKAIAGEAKVPFFSISGSDFVEMFVGVGASRVRSLFKNAKAIAPALIFIDELDAVGRKRGSGMGTNDEREQTLNQLLVEMDGFVENSGVIIVAATNRPDVLDPALKRPGRFDREIQLRLPDIREREEILKRHSKSKKYEKNILWSNIAKRTPGFSGAQLENVLNEAAILSIREDRLFANMEDIDEAIDRVIAGPSKTNNIISIEEKKLVSYHEAGHAVIGLILEKAQKVQKITIIPRGDAGGYVLMTPKKEKFIQTKSELEAQLVSYLGGRVSEEIFFGPENITTGAYSDIQEATKIAKRMVTEFGMSSLGPVQFHKSSEQELYGQESSVLTSSTLKNEIDTQILKLINESYARAYKIILENKDLIELFAKALMLKETINLEEIEYIYKNRVIPEEFFNVQMSKANKTSFKIEEFVLEGGITIFASPKEIKSIKDKISKKLEQRKLEEQNLKKETSNKTSQNKHK